MEKVLSGRSPRLRLLNAALRQRRPEKRITECDESKGNKRDNGHST